METKYHSVKFIEKKLTIDEAICHHAVYFAIWKKYGCLPERFNWKLNGPDVKFYPLRPEFMESTYLLYQVILCRDLWAKLSCEFIFFESFRNLAKLSLMFFDIFLCRPQKIHSTCMWVKKSYPVSTNLQKCNVVMLQVDNFQKVPFLFAILSKYLTDLSRQ